MLTEEGKKKSDADGREDERRSQQNEAPHPLRDPREEELLDAPRDRIQQQCERVSLSRKSHTTIPRAEPPVFIKKK